MSGLPEGWQPVGLGTFDSGAAEVPCTFSPPDHVAGDGQTLQPRDRVHHVPEGLHLQQGRLPPCRSVEDTGSVLGFVPYWTARSGKKRSCLAGPDAWGRLGGHLALWQEIRKKHPLLRVSCGWVSVLGSSPGHLPDNGTGLLLIASQYEQRLFPFIFGLPRTPRTPRSIFRHPLPTLLLHRES